MSILIEHIKLRKVETNNFRKIDKSSENYGPLFNYNSCEKSFILLFKVMTLLSESYTLNILVWSL